MSRTIPTIRLYHVRFTDGSCCHVLAPTPFIANLNAAEEGLREPIQTIGVIRSDAAVRLAHLAHGFNRIKLRDRVCRCRTVGFTVAKLP